MTATADRVQPFTLLLPIFGGFIGGAIAAAQVWPRSKVQALMLFGLGLLTTAGFFLLLENPTFSRVVDRGF